MDSEFAAMYERQLKEVMKETNKKQRCAHHFITKNTRKKYGNVVNLFSDGIAGKQRIARQWAIDKNKTHSTTCMPCVSLTGIRRILKQSNEVEVVIVDTTKIEKGVLELLKKTENKIIIFCTNRFVENEQIIRNYEVPSENEFFFAI